MRVLLVEPDDDFCLSLRQAITGAGCRVTITGSFAEASEVLRELDGPDLVITSATLPDGSGLLLARQARALGKAAFLLRRSRGRIELCGPEGVVARGDPPAIIDDLTRNIRARRQP